jgi:DNA repair exonuclease SbcCD ATPase subunit
MRIDELRVAGFGKLTDRTFRFDPRFTVVYGPNEAGKSTLTTALLGTLYGLGRGEKDRWRPWSGARFATALTYSLADGRSFEVQRDFERDAKGVRVYDEHGNDASAECSVGKIVTPGHAHLGIPVEVFVNASFVGQGEVAIDGARAERITHSLAHALDGGPKEDAALGAMHRLDEALALHVGRKKATVNAPLRHLIEELEEAQARAEEMRARLRELDDVRARLALETQRSQELDAALREQLRRGRSLRAYTLRSRLDALREIRDDLAALQAERAQYDDVDGFPSYLVTELEELYREWHTLDALARSHAEEAARNRMTPALQAELDERSADGGALDDEAFAALEAAGAEATDARNRATVAADRAQSARRSIEGGGELFGVAFTAGAFVALGTVILAVIHDWTLAAVVGVFAVVLFAIAWNRWSGRRNAVRTVAQMQKAADDASAAEREAAGRVAVVLERLGVASIEELAKRRERAQTLRARKTEASALAERAAETRSLADAKALAFDELAVRLVPESGSRERDLNEAKAREVRKSTRDGIDVRLSMLDVRRTDVLGSDDEFALETELAELLAAGVEPAPLDGASPRAFEAERGDIERRSSETREAMVATAAELRTAEAQIGDLAALDERVLALRARVEHLERFDAAVSLAKNTIDARTREAHQKFARRLADYASTTFARVTGDRYLDVRVDPTTLAVRVRAPETGEILDVERLSAGTREQAYLVVRLAMVRMFSEGLETAPLLLDDPFAFWDERRIENSFPILAAMAETTQIVLFTTSRELAAAATARGARALDLDDSSASGGGAFDRDQDLPLLSQA